MNKLKVIATNAGMFIKRHIPEILAAVGTVAVAWGTVEACKATRKLDLVLDECEARKQEIIDRKGAILDDREYKKELTRVYVENGWELCKLYGPSALLIIGGLVSLNSGVVTLRKQNTALAAAYAVLRESFDDYRAKVRGNSPEAEKAEVEYIHAAEARPENEELDKTKPITYTLLYDATTAREFSQRDGVNMVILKAKQRYLSQKLRGSETGVLTLNEICRELNLYIDSYKDGDSWGIIYDPRINGDQVDLGFEDDFMFAHGYEKSCWLKFKLVYVADRLPRIEEEMES